MAIANNQYDIEQLAKVDSNGFQAALFPQIKDAYVKKMQEIYGYDIDVSSASADGQFVMAESLVLNNIYRTLESLSDNLSPASATGKYLDILASLSGAFRQGATYSTATVYIANNSTVPLSPAYLLLNDKNGNRWQWINPIGVDGTYKVTFSAKDANNYTATAITVTCTELGAISAAATGKYDMSKQTDRNIVFGLPAKDRGGDIFETINASSLLVYQNDPAITGNEEESDASLRARRLRTFGQSGRTVEDSLVANLLNTAGVADAYVIPNNTSTILGPVADGVIIPEHSVYVVVAKQPNINVPDETIALTIYNAMTPGIPTYTPNAESTDSGTFKSDNLSIIPAITNTIKWKESAVLQPCIKVTLNYRNNITSLSDAQKAAIYNAGIAYLNELTLGEDFNTAEMQQLLEASDFRTTRYGLPSFEVTNIAILKSGSNQKTFEAVSGIVSIPLTKFYYTDAIAADQTTSSTGCYIYFGIADSTSPETTGEPWPNKFTTAG